VPTSVVVTDATARSRARISSRSRSGSAARAVHKIAGGHLSFAYPAFGRCVRDAVDSVAKRTARAQP
jgi:hypothetical protein